MSNLRSQFKATSIKTLKKVVDKDNAFLGVSSNEYLQLEDGKTLKIRIFPAHPNQEAFYVSKKCYWLPFQTRDGEARRGTVLDSVMHGGTALDIVQEYVKLAKKRYAKDSEKINALTGTGVKSNSLNPQYSWICYADIINGDEALSPKLWEFKKTIRDGLNKLSFSEDEDEPIEVDPFTDVDEGLPVLVKYLKNPDKKKGENFYEVSFAKKPVARPLSDEELDAFAKLKPLSEVVPAYTIKEFDRALEGLQQFDEDNDMGMFEDDEWLEIVEKVKAQYSDDSEEEEEEKPKSSKKISKAKKQEVEEEEEDEEETNSADGDEFDDMDRSALKRYIVQNSLDVTVKKSMSDDDIRNLIRNAKPATPAEEEEEDDDNNTTEDNAEAEEAKDEAPKAKVSLADIRAKLAGKK